MVGLVWDWTVGLYLWLAALGAGIYLVAFLADQLSPEGDENTVKLGVGVSAPCLLVALAALILQSRNLPAVGLMLGMVVPSSGVSTAFWGLLLSLAVAVPLLLLHLAETRNWPLAPGETFLKPVLQWVYAAGCAVVALSTAWFLMGTSSSLWSSSYLLAELFVTSAALCGVAALLGLARARDVNVGSGTLSALHHLQPILLAIQAGLLVLLLLHLGLQPSLTSLILPFLEVTIPAALLWAGGVVVGIALPLVIELWLGPARGWDLYPSRLLVLSPLLVVLGALSLRLAFVFAGQA